MNLTTAFEDFVKTRRGRGLIVATVQSVDESNYLFDAKDAEGNDYLDVRINAVPGVPGLMTVPEVGSTVIITDLGNQDQDFVLVQAGSIQYVQIHAEEETEIRIDGTTIRIGNNNLSKAVLGEELNTNLTTLITQIETLLDALGTFTTAQAAAAAGVLAPLAPAYGVLNASSTAIKAQIELIDLDTHLSSRVKITD
jgi:hypothetical protein